jgi:hypothetical protein
MKYKDEIDRICKLGTQAWKRLKQDKNWNDYMALGEAIQAHREEAMNEAGTNAPEGSAYNKAFGARLKAYGLDDFDESDRKRLFDVMDNRAAIEEWGSALTRSQKLAWNHPTTVWRHWKASTTAPKPREPTRASKQQEANVALETEIAGLKEHIAELEAARDIETTAPQAYPDDQGGRTRRVLDTIASLVSATKISTMFGGRRHRARRERRKLPSGRTAKRPGLGYARKPIRLRRRTRPFD